MILFDWFLRMRRRKAREERITTARNWPSVSAKLLPGELVDKDELAAGTVAQDRQVEFPFYFSLPEGFFGGHLRTVACSEGEARRLMKQVAEGTAVMVRYKPENPDEVCVLADDNLGALPVGVWDN